MTQKDILNYIHNPGLIQSADKKQLKYFVWNNPFYQAGHFILLKYLKENNDDDYNNQLIKSSIHVTNRDLLFKFLNTEFETTHEQQVIVENREPDTFTEKEENQNDVSETKEESKENKNQDRKILKNKNVKRKINNSFEGMGENISETISSQLEFSVIQDKDKLEYPSEIYFIDEERNGKNNILTIDADPEEIKKLRKKKDILQIDESQLNKKKEKNNGKDLIVDDKADDAFELIETDETKKEDKKDNSKQSEYFDINQYDDGTINDDDLISQFLEKNPRIEAKEPKGEVRDISEKSVQEDSNLLSETLIKVYIKQGLCEKAIESYHKLSLKYPEKSAYFASQIRKLEDKLNK